MMGDIKQLKIDPIKSNISNKLLPTIILLNVNGVNQKDIPVILQIIHML